MRRRVHFALLVVTFLLVPTTALAAEEMSVPELLAMAAELSEREVVVEGELVGDYGFRGDGSMWTQLNGDAYVDAPIREGGLPVGGNVGIGVRMPAEMARALDPPGGYRNRGPVVALTGIWKYHDPGRQGESYLEVQTLEVVEAGRQLNEEPSWTVIILGVLLLASAAAVWFLTPLKD